MRRSGPTGRAPVAARAKLPLKSNKMFILGENENTKHKGLLHGWKKQSFSIVIIIMMMMMVNTINAVQASTTRGR